MKLLSAIGNQHIQDSLIKSYPELEFLLPDLAYQEGILEALQNNTPDAMLITLDIEGEMDDKTFIEALRNINDTVKIILIIKSDNKEFDNWLISKGIFDVFIDGCCTFEDIHEALKCELKVIIKKEVQKEYIQKERVITRERIIKEPVSVSFKKLVLSIWGSTEFACELAYVTAQLTDYNVLLVELDCFSPKADIYLGLSFANHSRDAPDNCVLLEAVEQSMKGTLNKEVLDRLCLRRRELPNLYILSGNSDHDGLTKLKDKDIPLFIEQAYRIFEIVILVVNPSVSDPVTPDALMKSDCCLAAFPACADSFRDFENFLLHMKMKHNLPLDRIRYAAWEYKKDLHYPISHLKEIFPCEAFLGTVTYTKEREHYRNLHTCYARRAVRKYREEYIDILGKFNILPKRTYQDRAKSCLNSIMKPFCRIISKKLKQQNKNHKEANDIEQKNHP